MISRLACVACVVCVVCVVSVAAGEDCYWNRACPYLQHSTQTPYETVRGDIRDYPDPATCEAWSVWTLHRHGNRNPGSSSADMKRLVDAVQQQVVVAHEAGRGRLCAQDIEALRKWSFNDTILAAESYLTGTGYQELHDIGERLRQRYPHLLHGSAEDYYLRPTDTQRTVTSAMGFVHGLTDGTDLNLTIDGPLERDDVIRPYENCLRYQQEVKESALLEEELQKYAESAEYVEVLRAVQERLGITYQLSVDELYTLYELCSFHRTWSLRLQDAWCAAFSDQDLLVLDYRTDVRHYYRNGYGSWVTVRLGGPVLAELRARVSAAARGSGGGARLVSYFTHDTMLEMTFAALGLFRDARALSGARRDPDRLWRTSYIATFATNIIVVLNRCTESGSTTHRVQFFVNEKPTELCPVSGCSWEQFSALVAGFDDDLSFCSAEYPAPEWALPAAARRVTATLYMLTTMMVTFLCLS